MHSSSNGNVLFLILIAVALFAALSYAITSSTRSGGGNADKEKTALMAAEMIQYGSSVQNAVLRMRITGECSDTDISFENSSYPTQYVHTPPVANKCKIFHAQGGNIPYREPLEWRDVNSAFYNDGNSSFWGAGDIGLHQIGTAAPELTLSYWGIKKTLCEEINNKLGINNVIASPEMAEDTVDFRGIYSSAPDIVGDNVTAFAGQPTGCFYTNYGSYNIYVYYQVLVSR